jgi:diguanylate cyclase (GGDEF)-like protein
MEKIALLYDASQAVLSTFDLDQVLNRILAIAHDHFRLENGAVALLDPATQSLKVRAWMGSFKPDTDQPLKIGQGLTGAAVKLLQPVYAPDVRHDPRYIESISSTRSEIAIPLVVREGVVGVLDFQSDQTNFFDPESIDLLTLFATQASIAIQNAYMYGVEQQRSKHLEAINAIARQATALLELDELLDKLCSLIRENFHADHVSVVLCQADKLIVRRHCGKLTPRFRENLEFNRDLGLCGRALTTRSSVVENDVSSVPGYVAGYEECAAEACLPLMSFGESLGVLVLDSATRGAFDASDVQALQPVADICATAIQNAHHYEHARQLANVDGLTGIYNRRFFEQRILEEMERCRRYQSGMSVLMIDIDNFKRLNDEFGHLLGDEVLRQVSQIFVQQLRKIDVVCRFGGEEFAILVPETTGASALQVSEKLRRMIETWNFPGVPRPVTVSIGIAEFPVHSSTRDELVGAADAAMYLAKSSGRNRVFVAPQPAVSV